jgi:hypothetical protein
MKKLITFIFAIMILLSFTACNNIANNISTLITTPVKYIDGYDFSDGVTWVKSEEDQWHCVEKSGKILFKLEEGENPISNFSHNIALVKRLDYTIEVVDKSGKMISSPKMGEYDEIKGIFLDSGMISVYKKLVTFQITEDETGIIDNSGNWRVMLNNSSILSDYINNFRTLPLMHIVEQDRDYHTYIGDGLIVRNFYASDQSDWSSLYDKDYYEYTLLYNIKNGDTISVNLSQNTKADSVRRVENLHQLENGHAVYTVYYYIYTKSGFGGQVGTPYYDIYSISSSGQVAPIISNISGLYTTPFEIGNYKSGLFYCTFTIEDRTFKGFYDITGKMVIDLSFYDIYNKPEFSNDYCLLNLLNPQGTRFFTIIDKNGNQMFEPRILYSRSNPILSCGLMVTQNEDGNNTILNISGDIVLDLGKSESVSDYSDDVAMVKNDGEIYYIDKTGKRLF